VCVCEEGGAHAGVVQTADRHRPHTDNTYNMHAGARHAAFARGFDFVARSSFSRIHSIERNRNNVHCKMGQL